MSSQPIISVEGLGKSYALNHQAPNRRGHLLREVVAEKCQNLLGRRRAGKRSGTDREKFWALSNINFEVKQGEVIGVIGRNGAGKSTLLKILSRITEPSSGRVRLSGRVASLLEVGTGFHPELSGRENIYLNGAIVGMSRDEIKKKFDAIVDFSGVEKFLDTPVKRYSSGMYMRLAFAVAAHIETEIMIIDEVLAVGDAQFQKKCLGKMEDVSRSGRTVLFVSHNMGAVEELCKRAIVLEAGNLIRDTSDVRKTIREYLFGGQDLGLPVWINDAQPKKDSCFHLEKISVTGPRGELLAMPARNDSEMYIELEGEVVESDEALTIGYAIYTEDGDLLYWSYQTDVPEHRWQPLKAGHIRCRSKLPARLFNEGGYRIEGIASLHFRQWIYAPGVNAPHVSINISGGLSDSPYWMAKRPGLLAPIIEWKIDQNV